METSPSLTEISKALLKFQAKVEAIAKDSVNPHFKNKFASLAAIKEEIQPVLNECELVLTQWPEGDDWLTTLLVHAPSGEYHKATVRMHLKEQTSQGMGSGITYLRRYTQLAIFNLITDDDDGNAATSRPSGADLTQGTKPVASAAKLTAVRQWVQSLPRAQRETAVKAVFGASMLQLPDLPQHQVLAGMELVDLATKSGIKWDSPSLVQELKKLEFAPDTDDIPEPQVPATLTITNMAPRVRQHQALRHELHTLLEQIPTAEIPDSVREAQDSLTVTVSYLSDCIDWARKCVQQKERVSTRQPARV